MTSRYMIDIENRKSKIIHVYRNGDKYNRAALVLLRPMEQQKLERIFKAIEEKLTLPYNKPIKRIFTIKGREIDDPIMIKDQKYYVVSSLENFVNTRYGSIIKWAIIGPVKWSKFADVFYEPPEQEDLSTGNKVIYRWKNPTQSSARFPSKMTKSMSAYPSDRKTTKPSRVMTLSMDQSKRPISEPSNDMKTAAENRNEDNGYFHSSDDKNSSADNSETSPKIITSHGHRSMDQFLNDSLKMYQQKDGNDKNGNDSDLCSLENNEIKSEENPERDEDNSKEHEIISLTNITENQKENELEKEHCGDVKEDVQRHDFFEFNTKISMEKPFENIENSFKKSEILNKSDDDERDDISENDTNEANSMANIDKNNEIISYLSVEDEKIEEASKTKEVDFTDNIDLKNDDETPENSDLVKDYGKFGRNSDYNDSEKEHECSNKDYVTNLPEANYADEVDKCSENKLDYVKHQISENENYKDTSKEIAVETEDGNQMSLGDFIGNTKFSGILESQSNKDTDESDMELDKHSKNVEENSDQQRLSKSSSLKDDNSDGDNTSNKEDSILSEPVKNNLNTSNNEKQYNLIEKDEKTSDILKGFIGNEDKSISSTSEDHDENDDEVLSENENENENEKVENENSEAILNMNKDLSKFKEKEIDSKSSSEVSYDNEELEKEMSDSEEIGKEMSDNEELGKEASNNEDLERETSDIDENDDSVIIRETIKISREDINNFAKINDDPFDSSIKINSDEERLRENQMFNFPIQKTIESGIEKDGISEKSNHDFEEENEESEHFQERRDDLDVSFNNSPKEQYDRINIQLKDSSEFDEDHRPFGQNLSDEKVLELDFNNDKLEQFNRIDTHQNEAPNCIENIESQLADAADHTIQQENEGFKESAEKDQMEQYNRIDMTLDNSVHCIEEKRGSLTSVSDCGGSELEIGHKVSNITEVADENDSNDCQNIIGKGNSLISETSDNEKDSIDEELELSETNEEIYENKNINTDLYEDEFAKNKAATIIQESFRKHLERADRFPNSEHGDTENEIDSELKLEKTESHNENEPVYDNSKELVSNHEIDPDDAAAIIQKSFREHLTRKDLVRDSKPSDNIELENQISEFKIDNNEKNNSESLIQLTNPKEEQDYAAKMIQKTFRGHLVRKELVHHNKQLDAEEDLESEGEQHRSYDVKDSDDENDPDINFSLLKDATNDLNTEEILDDHSQLDNTYSDDAFALNNKF